MPKQSKGLSVEEALSLAETTDSTLAAFEATAPETVRAMGGRDVLARVSQPTCIGPVPRLDAETWERMAQEYEDTREHSSRNRGLPRGG